MDDVYSDGKLIYKIDGFQLSYTFPFMSGYDLGWKAVTSTVSDIITKGGKPYLFLASLGIRNLNEIEEIVKGISDAVNYYGGKYVGGDLNSSDGSGWIDVVGIGNVTCNFNRKISEGDVIIITNPIGYTSLVFLSFLKSWTIPLSAKLINKVKHPIVNKGLLKVIEEYCEVISYTTDISDGLVISLYNIIERKNISIELDKIPFDPEVESFAQRHAINEAELLKYSGEEFESLLVVDKNYVDELINEMKRYGFEPIVIGKVAKSSIPLLYKGKRLEKTGWDNFLGWF